MIAARKPRVVCVSQARMTSTRLPGKVLLPVLGRPLLEYHLERLGRSRLLDQVVLATTVNASDDPLAALGAARGLTVVRGSEDDVLSRYALAAAAGDADVVVRVTSDCPLIDPQLVDQAVAAFLEGGADYCSIDVTTYPRGLDCEVFSRVLLDEAHRLAADPYEREHVTPYIHMHPERFRLCRLVSPLPPLAYRWCVDEPGDFALVSRLIETLYPGDPAFGWRDCVAAMQAHPHWQNLNANVLQKTHQAGTSENAPCP